MGLLQCRMRAAMSSAGKPVSRAWSANVAIDEPKRSNGDGQACGRFQGETFGITVSTLDGATSEVYGLHPAMSLGELLARVAASRGKRKVELVTVGGDRLANDRADVALSQLGVRPGVQLTIVSTVVSNFYESSSCPRTRLLLDDGGACRLASVSEGNCTCGADAHHANPFEIHDVLVGTYALMGDVAVCTWTRHAQHNTLYKSRDEMQHCHDPRMPVRGWAEVGAEASQKWRRIDLKNDFVPLGGKLQVPARAVSDLGMGLFEIGLHDMSETDSADAMELLEGFLPSPRKVLRDVFFELLLTACFTSAAALGGF
eukprot:CAMPEP_0117538178 /NCGR_PEP_ID=MMETSP0784-20121206/42347_1 /TAXON_ID=39447 /ORGANISM="" /LENGTH=314 /DNA_ID=CAMNT_0005334789 /DNA_START=40 /DNA_END=984 /DNA_ORIENTATION=-